MSTVVVCPIHLSLPPIHGPQRIRWIVTHRACFNTGITEHDTPAGARRKAITFWSKVDTAIDEWCALSGITRPGNVDTDEWVDWITEATTRPVVRGSD